MSRRDEHSHAFTALANTLTHELSWFCRVLDTRLKLHFAQETPITSVDAPHVGNPGVGW